MLVIPMCVWTYKGEGNSV